MEKKIFFDFKNIQTIDDFYREAKQKLNLPHYFGNNLDALYDTITGDLEMPLHIRFVNLSLKQMSIFEKLLSTLKEAAHVTKGFTFVSVVLPSIMDKKE